MKNKNKKVISSNELHFYFLFNLIFNLNLQNNITYTFIFYFLNMSHRTT